MSSNTVTDAYFQALQDGEFVEEAQEGSNKFRLIKPTEMLALRKLQNECSADQKRASEGLFLRAID